MSDELTINVEKLKEGIYDECCGLQMYPTNPTPFETLAEQHAYRRGYNDGVIEAGEMVNKLDFNADE